MAGGPGHRAEGHVKLPPLLSQDRRALAALALYDFSSRFVVECGPSSGLPTMQPPGVGFLNPTHYTQPAKKPLAKPNFIGLDGEVLSEPQLSRARDLGVLTPVKDCPPCPARTHNGFFPPVKLRSPVSDGSKSQRGLSKAVGHHSRTLSDSPSVVFELALEPTEPIAPALPALPSNPASQVSHPQFYSYPPVYPHLLSDEVSRTSRAGGDLSRLPRPKRIASRGDIPWVYRYKLKKSMNELSKIMASRPPNNNGERTVYYPLF